MSLLENFEVTEDSESVVNDWEFCSLCGTIINTTKPTLPTSCINCNHPIDTLAIIGKVKKYMLELTPWDFYLGSKKARKAALLQSQEGPGGPTDESRSCGKCGHKGMQYTTAQLRSADEGQTVFYFCVQCKHREMENS
ncbi:Zinc finger TFIIS-type [Trinorchestia longiramus]|nr:Zinc finger TFIIS-type [Trinorchestia longiramus]